MIKNGTERPLELVDIEPLSDKDGAFLQSRRFEMEWEKQLSQGNPSLLKTLNGTYGNRLYFSALIYLIITFLHLLTPIVLNLLIQYLVLAQTEVQPFWNIGIFFAFSLFLISVLKVALDCQYFYVLGRTDVRLKVALKSIIYKKMLKLSNESRKKNTGGNISNLISIDAHTIGRWIYVINDTWEIPLLIISSVVFSFYFIGWPTFAGLAVMVIFTPLATYIAKWISYQTDQVLLAKDNRARAMNELLKAIRVIKSCALEENFQKKIELLRSIEYKQLIYLSLLETLQFSVINSIPILSCLITFSLYGLFEGNLSSANAFTALALLHKMKETISKIPHYVSSTTKGFVSIDRIEKFLLLEENKVTENEDSDDPNDISITNGSFQWDKDQENPTLKNINIQIQEKQLISVIGEVGAGKSSLLCSIFGELEILKGSIVVNGTIAYCAQEPWILNSTLKENILCGNLYDEKRYQEILRVCALEPDIQILPGGDLTEIGERGINLSGGQKWRVSLARACYQNSDIYLLDSPLSAVDAHVGKIIFNECINGYLKDKTRILVTHSLNYLESSDSILIMENGEIVASGTYSHLMNSCQKFKNLMKNITKDSNEKIEKSRVLDETQIKEYVTLTEKEEKKEGYISPSVIFKYYLGYSIPIILIVLSTGIFYQFTKILTDSWISIWTSHMIQPDPGVGFYIYSYISFALYGILSGILVSFFILIGSIISSNKLHHQMFHSIIHAPISFFDTTPLGRIMNRFSKDQHSLDVHLSNDSLNAFLNILNIIGIFCVIIYVTPWFSVTIIPIGILYYKWQKNYRDCAREISRLKSITLSPIYNHVSGSCNGITSIRAYGYQSLFIERNENNVNIQGSVEFTSALLARWLAFRLEFTACLFIFCASIFAVTNASIISPSLVGLSVTYSLSLTYIFNWFIKVITMLEQDLVCAERIIEYQNIIQEKPFYIEEEKPKEWPIKGRIEFKNAKMRYRDNLPFALNGVSFEIKGGEKIGIVGRTGAGKSSLALSLFRIFELNEGKIEIDHVDISKLGLHDLRKNLCLIPQDPIIFSTTIRQNLDPFDEFSDYQIWTALEKLKMKKFIESFPKQLNDSLLEDGSNLSVGQKQLICLCRGILKNAKIVVLDEATSNIDTEYDEIIQKAIRSLFQSCTVITIAHRLNTILDYDRVMVVEKGKIVEYDSPKKLSQNRNSFFSNLLESANLKI